jgi:uncharacterized protein with HEPN domain
MRRDAEDAAALAADLTFERLQTSMRDQRAVVHAIEQIGEAASRVSDAFQGAHPEIAWRKIKGMRNRLVHDYENTDWAVVWEVLTDEIPRLIAALRPLIVEDDASGSDVG